MAADQSTYIWSLFLVLYECPALGQLSLLMNTGFLSFPDTIYDEDEVLLALLSSWEISLAWWEVLTLPTVCW